MRCDSVRCCAVRCGAVLCCAMLCGAVLCCAVLCSTVLLLLLLLHYPRPHTHPHTHTHTHTHSPVLIFPTTSYRFPPPIHPPTAPPPIHPPTPHRRAEKDTYWTLWYLAAKGEPRELERLLLQGAERQKKIDADAEAEAEAEGEGEGEGEGEAKAAPRTGEYGGSGRVGGRLGWAVDDRERATVRVEASDEAKAIGWGDAGAGAGLSEGVRVGVGEGTREGLRNVTPECVSEGVNEGLSGGVLDGESEAERLDRIMSYRLSLRLRLKHAALRAFHVDARDPDFGRTALHYACRRGRLDVVQVSCVHCCVERLIRGRTFDLSYHGVIVGSFLRPTGFTHSTPNMPSVSHHRCGHDN